jgi:hypothetical protein
MFIHKALINDNDDTTHDLHNSHDSRCSSQHLQKRGSLPRKANCHRHIHNF